MLGWFAGAAIEEGGAGECAPSRISRGKAESGREWERAGRRLEGMGVVPERWDDEAAEALALAGVHLDVTLSPATPEPMSS